MTSHDSLILILRTDQQKTIAHKKMELQPSANQSLMRRKILLGPIKYARLPLVLRLTALYLLHCGNGPWLAIAWIKVVLPLTLITTPYTYEIMLANKMPTLICLYLCLCSVGSVERPKMQGISTPALEHCEKRFNGWIMYLWEWKGNIFSSKNSVSLPFYSSVS